MFLECLILISLSVASGQSSLLPALVNPAYGTQPVSADVLSSCVSRNGEQVVEPNGSSYLQFKPSSRMDGLFFIQNTDGPSCQPFPLPELGSAAALQFEFRAPVKGDCDASVTVSMGCQTSSTVAINNYIDTGIISTADWRVVTIPVSVLKNNTGLQRCEETAVSSWDLSRKKRRMVVTLCSKCPLDDAQQHVCHVRNLQFTGSLTSVTNKAPTIAGLVREIMVPFGGVARLPAQISDDGLPGGALDVVLKSVLQEARSQADVNWQVVQSPPGYEAGQLGITPHSTSAGAAWASFAGAPAGTYVLAITASDGQLSRTENVTVNHIAWPSAVAITSPRENPLPGEPSYVFISGSSNTLTVKARLGIASSMAPSDYKTIGIDCSGPAPCTQATQTALQTVTGNASTTMFTTATIRFSVPGTYSISVKAEIATGVQAPGFPAVIQGLTRMIVVTSEHLVPRTVTWQPGTRIPYTAFHPNMPRWKGDPRKAGPGMMWPPQMQALANVVVAQGGTWSLLLANDRQRLLSAPNACILIPAGQTVVYDVCDQSAPVYRCIVVLGKLYFSNEVSTCLKVGTLQLQDGGLLYIDHKGTNQIMTNITFSSPEALNPVEDPLLINVGLQAYHANVYLRGKPRCGHSSQATGNSLVAGATSIQVAGAAVCWQPGDTLVFADTQELPILEVMYRRNDDKDKERIQRVAKQTELRKVVSVQSDGTTVLDAPLTYNHSSEAPIGMITRSITLQTDLAGSKARAHVFVSGLSTFQMQHVAIYDTGRTTIQVTGDTVCDPVTGAVVKQHYNPRGRYGCHSHKGRRPVLFHGLAVASTLPTSVPLPRHGLVCHDSHCNATDNVVLGFSGSGVFAEDGTETGILAGNLVVCSGFGTGTQDYLRNRESLGKDVGHGGHGFWMRGSLLNVQNNTAVGWCPQSAYTYFAWCMFQQSSMVPYVEGVDDGLRGMPLEVCKHGIGEHGKFYNNAAVGSFNLGLHHGFINRTSTLGKLKVLTFSAGDPKAFATTHSRQILLESPQFHATAPSNKGVGLSPLAGMGTFPKNDSLVINAGVIDGFEYGLAVFPNGTLLEDTTLHSKKMDIGFALAPDFEAIDGGANELVELRRVGDRQYIVLPKDAAIAIAATLAGTSAMLPDNITTDGVTVIGGTTTRLL